MFNWSTLIFTVADACTICEGFSLCVECFRLVEVNSIIGVKVFFETFDVAFLSEVDKNGVCEDVNFD